jgi:hypothetical protein
VPNYATIILAVGNFSNFPVNAAASFSHVKASIDTVKTHLLQFRVFQELGSQPLPTIVTEDVDGSAMSHHDNPPPPRPRAGKYLTMRSISTLPNPFLSLKTSGGKLSK